MFKAVIPPENPDANMKSYTEMVANFSWNDIEKEFTWHQTGNLNIAYEAVDQWAENPETANRVALIFEKGDKVKEFSYLQLQEISSQWSNLFIEYGFAVGDRMFIFVPPSPEYSFAMLACARLGIIFCPLFTTLGFDELEVRLQNAKPRGVFLLIPRYGRALPYAIHAQCRICLSGRRNRSRTFSQRNSSENSGRGTAEEELHKVGIQFYSTLPALHHFRLDSTSQRSYARPRRHGRLSCHSALCHLMLRNVLCSRTDGGEPGWVTGVILGGCAPWLCGATSVVQGDQFSWVHLVQDSGKI